MRRAYFYDTCLFRVPVAGGSVITVVFIIGLTSWSVLSTSAALRDPLQPPSVYFSMFLDMLYFLDLTGVTTVRTRTIVPLVENFPNTIDLYRASECFFLIGLLTNDRTISTVSRRTHSAPPTGGIVHLPVGFVALRETFSLWRVQVARAIPFFFETSAS